MNWEELLVRAYPEGRRNSIFHRRGEADDPRLGEMIKTWDRPHEIEDLIKSHPAVFIIGVADDQGVRVAQGRPGARLGPNEIRSAFYKFTPGFAPDWTQNVVDLGNVRLPSSGSGQAYIKELHLRLEELVYYISLTGARVVVLGGGQDHTYATVTGFSRARRHLAAKKRVQESGNIEAVDWFGLINVDKFLDVRDPALSGLNSGTAFFRLLEEEEGGAVDPTNFVSFALQEHHCSPVHRKYLLSKGATLISLEQFWLGRENILNSFSQALDTATRGTLQTFLSFDMNATVLPGVSAPSPLGLQPGTCCAMAAMAGERGLAMLELMETAPPHDGGQTQTSTLAATMLFYYLRGLATGEHIEGT